MYLFCSVNKSVYCYSCVAPVASVEKQLVGEYMLPLTASHAYETSECSPELRVLALSRAKVS